ncbi:uncharacterized protein BDFB_005970 [Asbolus verrucosus]|uniref:Uncharacterized protein n=1 Tax=Asbolus verrucosus TaxID=1661398 RepID=A0A482VZ46_ASBVE|nr:uncharacterized protein BDFB_005970 [Asbolus verrucosus]
MWKRFSFVILILSVPVLSKFSSSHVVNRIIDKLGLTLDYISKHYEKINVDCLFGVVLAGAILDDSIIQPGPYQKSVQALKAKTLNIYSKTLPLMEKQENWSHCKY